MPFIILFILIALYVWLDNTGRKCPYCGLQVPNCKCLGD